MKLRSIISSISLPFISNLANMASGSILFYFLYKNQSLEFITIYILGLAIYQISIPITRAGLESIGILKLSSDNTFFHSSITIKGVLGLISIILINIIGVFYNSAFEGKNLLFLIISFGTIGEILTNQWALIELGKLNMFLKIKIIITFLILAIQVYFSQRNLNPLLIPTMKSIQLIIEGLFSFSLIIQTYKILTPTFSELKNTFKEISQYLSASIYTTVSNRIPHLIIGNSGTSELLNLYDFFFKIIKIIEIPFVLTQTVLLPKISHSKIPYRKNLGRIVLMTTVIFLFLNILGKPLFLWYTSDKVTYNHLIATLVLLILPLTSVSSYLGSELLKRHQGKIIKIGERYNLIVLITCYLILSFLNVSTVLALIIAILGTTLTLSFYKIYHIEIHDKKDSNF